MKYLFLIYYLAIDFAFGNYTLLINESSTENVYETNQITPTLVDLLNKTSTLKENSFLQNIQISSKIHSESIKSFSFLNYNSIQNIKIDLVYNWLNFFLYFLLAILFVLLIVFILIKSKENKLKEERTRELKTFVKLFRKRNEEFP